MTTASGFVAAAHPVSKSPPEANAAASGTDKPSLGVGELDRRGRLWAAAASLGAPAAVAASVLLSGTDLQRGPVVCPLRLTTGLPCPFCGMTTSFAHMGGLRLKDAFLANPAGPLLFAAVVLGGLTLFSMAVTGRRPVYETGGARWVHLAVRIAAMAAVAMMWTAELLRFGIL